MAVSIEFKLLRTNAAAPAANVILLSTTGGLDILTVQSGTEVLQLSDGTNNLSFPEPLIAGNEVMVRIVDGAGTMNLGVDGFSPPESVSVGLTGVLEVLVNDPDYIIRDILVYDEKLADPWVSSGVITDNGDIPGIAVYPSVAGSDYIFPISVRAADMINIIHRLNLR